MSGCARTRRDDARRRLPQRRGRFRSTSSPRRNPATRWARRWRSALRAARRRRAEALRRRRPRHGGCRHCKPVCRSTSLSIIGLTAIPQKLPTIFRRIRETAQAVVAARPDALVIIDSPDFTHRVARRVRRLAPTIPILDYVSPSVWAWRPGPGARHARLCRSRARHPAVRAGGPCASSAGRLASMSAIR